MSEDPRSRRHSSGGSNVADHTDRPDSDSHSTSRLICDLHQAGLTQPVIGPKPDSLVVYLFYLCYRFTPVEYERTRQQYVPENLANLLCAHFVRFLLYANQFISLARSGCDINRMSVKSTSHTRAVVKLYFSLLIYVVCALHGKPFLLPVDIQPSIISVFADSSILKSTNRPSLSAFTTSL